VLNKSSRRPILPLAAFLIKTQTFAVTDYSGVRGSSWREVRPLAIFANFFEAGDLWPRARVFYGETEISVRMSFGIYRRVCSAVCRRYCLASKCRRRDACVTITQNAPLDLGPPPHRTPASRATRGAARARKRPCPVTKTAAASFSHRGRRALSSDAHLYGPAVGWAAAGSYPQAALGRFLQAHPISPFLFVTTSGRLSKQRARRLACSTQSVLPAVTWIVKTTST